MSTQSQVIMIKQSLSDNLRVQYLLQCDSEFLWQLWRIHSNVPWASSRSQPLGVLVYLILDMRYLHRKFGILQRLDAHDVRL